MTRPPSSDRWLAIGGVIATLCGLALGAFAMFAAWEHNPQEEFHTLAADGTITIQWGGWLLIGVGWFLLGAGVCCMALMFLAAIRIGLARLVTALRRRTS